MARQNSLTPDQQQNLAQRAAALNSRNIEIGKQTGRVANAALEQNPTQQINQTYNTFRDIVDTNKVITPKQLIDKGFTESKADDILERIQDVYEEAKDSKEYSGISKKVIAYAVLDDFIHADSTLTSDKSYLKRAVEIQDKIKALQTQSSLVDMAQGMSRADAQIQANNYFGGY